MTSHPYQRNKGGLTRHEKNLKMRERRQELLDTDRKKAEKIYETCKEAWKKDVACEQEAKQARREASKPKPVIDITKLEGVDSKALHALHSVPVAELLKSTPSSSAALHTLQSKEYVIAGGNKIDPSKDSFARALAHLVLSTACETHLGHLGHAPLVRVLEAAMHATGSPHTVAQLCLERARRATSTCGKWGNIAKLFGVLGEIAMCSSGEVHIRDPATKKTSTLKIKNAWTETVWSLYGRLERTKADSELRLVYEDSKSGTRYQIRAEKSLAWHGLLPGGGNAIRLIIVEVKELDKHPLHLMSEATWLLQNLFAYPSKYSLPWRSAMCPFGKKMGAYCSGRCSSAELCLPCCQLTGSQSASKHAEGAVERFSIA